MSGATDDDFENRLPPKGPSKAMFYIGKDGKPTDEGLFDDEPAHPKEYYGSSVDKAIERGLTREEAIRSYVPEHHRHLFTSQEAKAPTLSEVMGVN